MAGSHFFAKLRSHGVKLAKFKQGYLLEELKNRGELGEGKEAIADFGACAALCCMWLYTKLNEHPKSLHRSAGEQIETSINLPFAKIGADLQHEYLKNFDPREWSQLTTNLYQSFDLKIAIDGARRDGLPKLLGAGAGLLKWSPGVLLSLDLANGKGHAIAMCNVAGETYFFDPNAGEYKVTELKPFLIEYAKAGPKALGYAVTGGHQVGVSKKT